MIGLFQRVDEAAVAEDEYADWHEEPERYRQNVERHLQSAVGDEQTALEDEVSRGGGVLVRSGTDKRDDGERPERRKLDERGDHERGNDGQASGGHADQIASVQWTTDDHVGQFKSQSANS